MNGAVPKNREVLCMKVGMSVVDLTLSEVSSIFPTLSSREHKLRELLSAKSSFEFVVQIRRQVDDEEEYSPEQARVVFWANEKQVMITIHHSLLHQNRSLAANAQLCEDILNTLKENGSIRLLELAVDLYELLYRPLQVLITSEVRKLIYPIQAEVDALKRKVSDG